VLAEHGFATDELDALLAALFGCLGRGLSTCWHTSLAYSAWLKRSKPGARRKASCAMSGKSALSWSKNLAGLLATRGRSSSMMVSDSTPGQ